MPVLTKGYDFSDNQQVTSVNLDNLVDAATFASGAVDGTTTVLSGGQIVVGTIQTGNIAANAVNASKLASNSVENAKIADGAVTTTKLADSTGISDGVITAKIADDAVTQAKIADAAVGTAQLIDANITAAKLNGAQTGTAPVYGVRAWAKLNPYVGSVRTGAFKSGSYTRTTTDTTVTIANHGLKPNDKIRLDFTSGTATDGLYTVQSSANPNEFVVNHTGAATSGNVTAQFVAIQASGNISTASWYDSGDVRIVLNFTTAMPNDDYALLATSQVYHGSWVATAAEDTDPGTAQLNSVYQAYVYTSQPARFMSVAIIG